MAVNSERGGAIMFLFIAVALFGALGYAFLQGSRSSTTLITSEADKAAAYRTQDCANAIDLAQKRLAARSCTSEQISYDPSGSVGTGPKDGSCALFHPNGGGVKACDAAMFEPCVLTGIASICTDGAIYIGVANGRFVFGAPADESPVQWKTTNSATPGATSTTDGLANTNAIIAAGAAQHPAANVCATKPPAGTWYLPVPNELTLFKTNSAAINPTGMGLLSTNYWSSRESATTLHAHTVWGTAGDTGQSNAKTWPILVRCVRR